MALTSDLSRLALMLAALSALVYLDMAGGSDQLAQLAGLTPRPPAAQRCAFPPLGTVAAAWAAQGAWRTPAVPLPQLYTWEEAITIHVGNSERYIDGCGEPAAREAQLRLRWAFNASGTLLPALPPWSRTATCAALRGRNIAVVGDSMSGEFFDALVSALWSGEHGARPAQRQASVQVCDGREDGSSGVGVNVTYTYFDHLGGSAAEEAALQAMLAELAGHLAARPPPIVVLNRGAHMKGAGEVAFPSTSSAEEEAAAHAAINAAHAARLQSVWAWLAATAPASPVFWRTTTTGHPFCRHTVHSPPLAAEQSMAEVLELALAADASSPARQSLEDFPDSDYRLAWHWDNIPVQNAATLAALPAGVHVLDVAHATALRIDSHPQFKYGKRQRQDCLHYCLPGPIDMWVELFAASVRYGEEGGAEFFSEQALAELCSGVGERRASRHVLHGPGQRGL